MPALFPRPRGWYSIRDVNAQSVPPLLLAAVTFYVGAYNLLIYIRRPRNRENLTLAASCFFFSLYDLFCSMLYNVSASGEGGVWQRRQGVALALATASFSWFVFDYLKGSAGFPARTKRIVTAISLAFVLTAVLLMVERSGLYWIMDRPLVKTVRLPFGGMVVYREVAPGPLSNVQSVMGFLAVGYLFAMAIYAYRTGARSLAVPLIVIMSLFSIAMVNDTAVSGGWYSFIYLIEYSYMMIVLLATNSLTMKVVQTSIAQEGLRMHAGQLEALRQLGMELAAELDLDSLLRSVVSRALKLLEAGSGGMYFFDPARDVIEWKIGVGPVQPPPGSLLKKGDGLPGRVWESGETLAVCERVADAPNPASMGAPVRWGGEFFGVLYVIGGTSRAFGAGEAGLLDLFASQAAIAIRNARLYEAAKSRAERLSVVNRIASAVGAALSLDGLLETVYRETAALFAPDAFFIALYDEKSREIELRFRVEDGFMIPPEKVPVGTGLTSRVISGKASLLIKDAWEEEGIGGRERGKSRRSWLGAPMLLRDRVIGVISVQSGKTGAYENDDAELLETIAEQIAAAVERARLYQNLRESEEKHRTLFEQAMDAVILQGDDGRILDANQRACELLGYERGELLLLEAADIAAPGSPLASAPRPDTMASGMRVEGQYVRRDGALIPVEASMAPLTVGGKPVVSVVAHDITQRKLVEERLRQAQKMEAIGTLAGGVAHDFNNILTGILGYASLLRQDIPVGSQLSADVEAIAGSARRAAELTRQLLTFSRRTPQLEREPLDIHGLIGEIKSLLERTIDKSISVETVLEARSAVVQGNGGQLHQALLNLCLNARDAMPNGGTLRIQTGSSDAPPGGRRHAGRLLLRISDTGVGMPQLVRDHLFEPFYTTKENGRGLGLAMVYGIVHSHGGEIFVSSSPGAGSVFEIALPLSRETARTKDSPKKRSPRRGNETILVVDDEKTVRGVLRRILEHDGYTVLQAEDGAAAVEKYKERPDVVSLVILDIAMPRMDGNQAYKALTAVNPKLKVLVSSGYSEEGRAADLLQKGARGFLRKPYASETVLAMVRKILDS
jgi:PAS domain S-box-containing protein